MANRFFPGNGNKPKVVYDLQPGQVKAGSILPMWDKGYLKSEVRGGERYVIITPKAIEVLNRVNNNTYIKR